MLVLNKGLYQIYFLCFHLLLTINLCSGRWWTIVCPTSGSFLATRKVVFPQHYVVCFRLNHSLVVHQVYQWYTCYLEVSKGLALILSPRLGINLYLSANQSVTLPPMIVGTFMCLSVIFLVNKYHYLLLWMEVKSKMCVVKPSVLLKDKLFCHENSCLLC